MRRITVMLMTLLVAGLTVLGAAPAHAAMGDFVVKAAPDACVAATTMGGLCSQAQGGFDRPHEVALSPDGRNVYQTVRTSQTLLVFDRATDGTLTQKPGADGCFNIDGANGCTKARGIFKTNVVEVSPDGKNVYVAGTESAIAIFDRAADGTLKQKRGRAGCVWSSSVDGECTRSHALAQITKITVAPDGRHVYVASPVADAVLVFKRLRGGRLRQDPGPAGCVAVLDDRGCTVVRLVDGPTDIVVSPDNKNVYVASFNGAGIASFDRQPNGSLVQKAGTDGCVQDEGFVGCTDGNALVNTGDLEMNSDGSVLFAAGNAVTTFYRGVDGVLSQGDNEDGCVDTTNADGCKVGKGLTGNLSILASNDGLNVYVLGGTMRNVLTVFTIHILGGLHSQNAACYSDDGSEGCTQHPALEGMWNAVLSPDGSSLYVAAANDDALSVFDVEEQPSLTIDDVRVRERDTSQLVTLTAKLSGPVLTGGFYNETANGTAKFGSDYGQVSLGWAFSQGETEAPVPVRVLGDKRAERTERFTVRVIRHIGVNIVDGTARVTIVDDDGKTGGNLPPCDGGICNL